MYRPFAAIFLISVSLFSCSKSEPAESINPGGINDSKSNTGQQNKAKYDGQWQWIGTSSGLFSTIPLADSQVVLTLNPDSTYDVTLNGQFSLQGTFSSDSSAYWANIKFNNITEPAGDTTSVTVGNITELYFNYSQVGRLVIYQNDEMTISGDTLTLLRTPITPETPVSLFKRIGN
ncbi:MAG TPA: hypothetical protein VNW49_05425 [Puia sp.]|nr:hypothetical protein [Puia sp.]